MTAYERLKARFSARARDSKKLGHQTWAYQSRVELPEQQEYINVEYSRVKIAQVSRDGSAIYSMGNHHNSRLVLERFHNFMLLPNGWSIQKLPVYMGNDSFGQRYTFCMTAPEWPYYLPWTDDAEWAAGEQFRRRDLPDELNAINAKEVIALTVDFADRYIQACLDGKVRGSTFCSDCSNESIKLKPHLLDHLTGCARTPYPSALLKKTLKQIRPGETLSHAIAQNLFEENHWRWKRARNNKERIQFTEAALAAQADVAPVARSPRGKKRLIRNDLIEYLLAGLGFKTFDRRTQ